MNKLPDAIVKLRDDLAEKRAFSITGNSHQSKEDWNIEDNFKAGFNAGYSAKASQDDECLRVAVSALKHYEKDVKIGSLPHMGPITIHGNKAREAIATIEKFRSGK